MASRHFDHQVRMAQSFVLPLLKKEIGLNKDMKVLEVGCAESGLIKVLYDHNIDCTGVEILQGRIDLAKKINPEINVIQGDITDKSLVDRFDHLFDLVIIRDVIEHIPEKEKAFAVMYELLKPGGHIYITFPPLYSPYAGHQQNCTGFFRKILWVHLLPDSIIRKLGRKSNEKESRIEEVILNSKIGLSISKFKKFYKQAGFRAVKKELFLSRPVYNIRWNWPVIKFPPIPVMQEFLATGCEYLLKKS